MIVIITNSTKYKNKDDDDQKEEFQFPKQSY